MGYVQFEVLSLIFNHIVTLLAAKCQVWRKTNGYFIIILTRKIGMMTMLLIHMEASFLFVVASQVEQWRVKWKSIQLLSSAAPQPSNWWDQSSNKTSFSRLSTWESEEILFNVALSKNWESIPIPPIEASDSLICSAFWNTWESHITPFNIMCMCRCYKQTPREFPTHPP